MPLSNKCNPPLRFMAAILVFLYRWMANLIRCSYDTTIHGKKTKIRSIIQINTTFLHKIIYINIAKYIYD